MGLDIQPRYVGPRFLVLLLQCAGGLAFLGCLACVAVFPTLLNQRDAAEARAVKAEQERDDLQRKLVVINQLETARLLNAQAVDYSPARAFAIPPGGTIRLTLGPRGWEERDVPDARPEPGPVPREVWVGVVTIDRNGFVYLVGTGTGYEPSLESIEPRLIHKLVQAEGKRVRVTGHPDLRAYTPLPAFRLRTIEALP